MAWHKASKKWSAQIEINGKNNHLGIFAIEHDAYLAYQKKLNSL